MFTKEQIEEAFESKKVIKQLEEREERRKSTKEAIEAANTPEAKQREQETKKALLARIESLEDRLAAKEAEADKDRSFGAGAGHVNYTPREWHEGLSYNDMLKEMRMRGDIR